MNILMNYKKKFSYKFDSLGVKCYITFNELLRKYRLKDVALEC